jgi:hypothetical protein
MSARAVRSPAPWHVVCFLECERMRRRPSRPRERLHDPAPPFADDRRRRCRGPLDAAGPGAADPGQVHLGLRHPGTAGAVLPCRRTRPLRQGGNQPHVARCRPRLGGHGQSRGIGCLRHRHRRHQRADRVQLKEPGQGTRRGDDVLRLGSVRDHDPARQGHRIAQGSRRQEGGGAVLRHAIQVVLAVRQGDRHRSRRASPGPMSRRRCASRCWRRARPI